MMYVLRFVAVVTMCEIVGGFVGWLGAAMFMAVRDILGYHCSPECETIVVTFWVIGGLLMGTEAAVAWLTGDVNGHED